MDSITGGPARRSLGQEERALLEEDLDRKLVASRPAGDRAGGVSYLEGHTVIAQLNRIFGYDGWGYSLDAHGIDEWTEGPEAGHYALFWARVTLHVAGSLPRTELGRCEVRNTVERKSGAVRNNVRNVDSRSTALTGAVTDALKRAARTYGQQFGNGLYDADGDVYRWMSARAEDTAGQEEPAAAAPGRSNGLPAATQDGTAGAARAAEPGAQEEVAAVQAEVAALLQADGAALELLRLKGTLVPQMDALQLRKAREWLKERAARAVPAAARLGQAIGAAGRDEHLEAARAQVQAAKDARQISQADYRLLLRDIETRRTALAGPLTAGAAS